MATPLIEAVRKLNDEAAFALLKAGADPMLGDKVSTMIGL